MNGNSECTPNQIVNHGNSVHIQKNSLLCIFAKLFLTLFTCEISQIHENVLNGIENGIKNSLSK